MREVHGYLPVGADQPWQGLDSTIVEALYDRYLEGTLASDLSQICAQRNFELPWDSPIIHSVRDATAILRWAAPRWPSVRLLACACDTLDRWGVRRFPVLCRPLGFDVVSLGEWSLLHAMLDARVHPGVHLNPHGLVDRLEDAMFEVAMHSMAGASPGEQVHGDQHPDVRGPVGLKVEGDPDPRILCR